jgi:hypothetical protein
MIGMRKIKMKNCNPMLVMQIRENFAIKKCNLETIFIANLFCCPAYCRNKHGVSRLRSAKKPRLNMGFGVLNHRKADASKEADGRR